MKLNSECVRELLLYLEKLPSETAQLSFDKIEIEGFSNDEIKFTGSMLVNSGLVKAISITSLEDTIPNYIFKSITFEGYKYLDNIRDPKVWKETKKVTSKFASVSLDIISSVAAKIITSYLKLD